MAKGKQKPPKDETKKAKFKRVVEPRVRKALKAIRLIGNCSGSAYEYTTNDVINIAAVLQKEIEQLDTRFTSKGAAAIEFNLD